MKRSLPTRPKCFNTLGREHHDVTGELLSNICKVGFSVEEMFHVIKHMSCRGTLSFNEDLSLTDIKVEVSIF